MKFIKNNILMILCIFICISPLLDSITYYMRNISGFNVSISTYFKPLLMGIIYILLLVNLFVSKKKWKPYVLSMIAIGIYTIIHIYFNQGFYFPISHSNLVNEIGKSIQIIYVFLVINNFWIVLSNHYDINLAKSQVIKALVLSATIYYLLFIISIITQTSHPSYSSMLKFGYQGWLNPSHLINHIANLSLPLVWYLYSGKNKKWALLSFLIISIPCYYFIGAKSGTYGVLAIVFSIFVFEIIKLVFKKEKKNYLNLIIVIVLFSGFILTFDKTLTYKNNMVLSNDIKTTQGKTSMKTEETSDRIEDTLKKEADTDDEIFSKRKKDYLNNMFSSVNTLKDMTARLNLSGADNRTNQIIYNGTLFFLSSINMKLFGTGYSNQPNNLYLENDLLAVVFNFGIMAFILTFFILLCFLIYNVYKTFIVIAKGLLFKFEMNYYLLVSIGMFILLSFTTGYIFFQPSLIIFYCPTFVLCTLTFLNHRDEISLKSRFRKYIGWIVRQKNRNKYKKEITHRENLDIFEYQKLAAEMPESYKELFKDNNLYGTAKCFRDYSNFKDLIDSYIEHGVNFSNSVYSLDIVAGAKNIISFSKKRAETINSNYDKEVLTVGPYIHYAKNIFGDKKLEKDRKELGKILVVFGAKSIVGVNHEYDIKDFIKEINKLKRNLKIDTVIVALYYYDIQREMEKLYLEEGFKIVTPGHKYDENYLNRLKYIISLADYTMSNSISTHIGYCLYLNKPHYMYDQEINISGENAASEFYEDRLKTYLESEKRIRKAFNKVVPTITKEQLDIYEEFWGTSEIKSKEELKQLLSKDVY